MVAARDIQPGEVIFSEEPLALGPSHDARPCCMDCMKPLNVKDSYLCPKCNLPVCEEMCSLGEEHSKECSILAGCGLDGRDLASLTSIYWSLGSLRLLRWRDEEPAKYDIIERMMDHNEEHRAKTDVWNTYKENVVDFLRIKCGLKDKYSEEELFHGLGVLDVNGVKINSGTGVVTGHGLYGLTALLSHSCLSNSKTVLKSDYSLDCKSTRFIGEGEEITKQYVSPLETREMRRLKLKRGWYFDCKCPRCQDPTEHEAFTSATRCVRCGDGSIVPMQVKFNGNLELIISIAKYF